MAKRKKPRTAAQKAAAKRNIKKAQAANRAKGGKKGGARKGGGSKGGGKHLAKANAHLAQAVLEMNLHHAAQRVGHEGGGATRRKRKSRK